MRNMCCVASFTVLLLASTLCTSAQLSAYDQPLHIYVQARTLEGSPIQWLLPDQFHVTSEGRRLPVISLLTTQTNAHAPMQPTHVLLLLSQSSSYSSENALADLVMRYLPEDFGAAQIAIREKDGNTTPYAGTRTALIQSLHSFNHRVLRASEALGELGKFRGQRSLIYFTENGENIPAQLRRKAQQIAALTYQVGGDRGQNYSVGNEGRTSIGGIGPYIPGSPIIFAPTDQGGIGVTPPPDVPLFSVSKSIREVLVVRTLRDAFRSLCTDSRGFYDAVVSMPPGVTDLELKLDLKYSYQLTAQDVLDGQRPPVLHLPTRQ